MNCKQLKELINQQSDVCIIDIREPYECDEGAISEINIPLNQVLDRIDDLPKNTPLILYCNSGKRSKALKFILEKFHAFKNIDHLEGGYLSWINQS